MLSDFKIIDAAYSITENSQSTTPILNNVFINYRKCLFSLLLINNNATNE